MRTAIFVAGTVIAEAILGKGGLTKIYDVSTMNFFLCIFCVFVFMDVTEFIKKSTKKQ